VSQTAEALIPVIRGAGHRSLCCPAGPQRAGVVLVVAAAGMSTAVRAGAAALPQAAFVGMGVMVLRERWRTWKLRAIRAR
jgi:hypothetical protein